MRKLSIEKRADVLNYLIESLSIRATYRLTGAAKVTVLRLLADAARVCHEHHDANVTNLGTTQLQCDEAWGFVGCKAKAKKSGATGFGNAWVWVAQDADTKLIVTWLVGQRDGGFADAFMEDATARIPGRVQISTDAFNACPFAVRNACSGRADFGVVSKTFALPVKEEARRYSPSVCIGCTKEVVQGDPDESRISTSYIERQNRDLRMRCRRMTRLTDAFSKRLENHSSAIALHYWAFNLVKRHSKFDTTPAVAAGIATEPLTMLDLVRMIEAEENKNGGRRITRYLGAA